MSKPQLTLYVFATLLLLLAACTPQNITSQPDSNAEILSAQGTQIAYLSTQVAQQAQTNQSQSDAISYLLTQMPRGVVTPTPFSAHPTSTAYTPSDQVPTDTPTPYVPSVSTYPPEARTGITEIDRVLGAVLNHDVESRVALVRYTVTNCTTEDGLGGPPKCLEGQENGTSVEVLPVADAEGTFTQRENIEKLMDFSVAGLLAVYHVPSDAHEAEYWPAGDYGLVFLPQDPNLPYLIIVLVKDGQIVRLDFNFTQSPYNAIMQKATEFVLPPLTH
jgi:hypothetical protein